MSFPPPARVFVILAAALAVAFPKVDANLRVLAVVALVALYVVCTTVITHAEKKWGHK